VAIFGTSEMLAPGIEVEDGDRTIKTSARVFLKAKIATGGWAMWSFFWPEVLFY